MHCFVFCMHNICCSVGRKIKFFFSRFLPRGCIRWRWPAPNKQDRKEKPNCVISSVHFENTLQIFLFNLLPWPLSSLCPDNHPGQPHLPEIPLFFWALISLTVGSRNYRIRLPKRSAQNWPLCSVLRGLRPDQKIQYSWMLIYSVFHLDQDHSPTTNSGFIQTQWWKVLLK